MDTKLKEAVSRVRSFTDRYATLDGPRGSVLWRISGNGKPDAELHAPDLRALVDAVDGEQNHAEKMLRDMCATFGWRTDGGTEMLADRVAHHTRAMRASIKAHQAVLAKERAEAASGTDAGQDVPHHPICERKGYNPLCKGCEAEAKAEAAQATPEGGLLAPPAGAAGALVSYSEGEQKAALRAAFEAELQDLYEPPLSLERAPGGGEYTDTKVRDMWMGYCLREFPAVPKSQALGKPGQASQQGLYVNGMMLQQCDALPPNLVVVRSGSNTWAMDTKTGATCQVKP